ncbi:acyl-CoA dehydrogenase family protein [Pigmentiphaga soli]|uniref:Acyl-CoA dehydrogenase family protein n=1 Tax=Pigmentiphaga soli TaxID=1007095 RepID=A0ABP8H8Q0_9BURK
MDVLLDEQETLIKRSAGEFLQAECGPRAARDAEKRDPRYSTELWKRFCELGWMGLSVPDTLGGQGLPVGYAGLVLEEAGRYIAPLPILSNMVAALVLAGHGAGPQRELVPRIVGGSLLVSCALLERSGRWDAAAFELTAREDGGGYVLEGSKYFVDHFRGSGKCLVAAARAGSPGQCDLFVVDPEAPGIVAERLTTLANDEQETVHFRAVRVPAEARVPGGAAAVAAMMDYIAVLSACMMEGAARHAMEMSAAYVSQRDAFGQPIGAFQAIQHLAADMLNAVDGCQLLNREALWLLGQGLPARVEIAQAKSFANEKCLAVVRGCQQMHGGIGFIAEFDINLWYRRVAAWSMRGGSTYDHRLTISGFLFGQAGPVRLGMAQPLPAQA